LCGEALTRTATLNHVRACAAAHDITSGPELALVQIRVTAPGLAAYWLDVEIKADAFVDNHPAPSARTALATNPTHLPARCTWTSTNAAKLRVFCRS
jgi:hypothetical protein